MKTYRVYLKSGQSLAVKAHHFTYVIDASPHATVHFYKDENSVDENIHILNTAVEAIVLEPTQNMAVV